MQRIPKFLVLSVALEENHGPEDISPGEVRWSRRVVCVRLDEQLRFDHDSERIEFTLNEPMSVAQPRDSRVTVVGVAELPIRWRPNEPGVRRAKRRR